MTLEDLNKLRVQLAICKRAELKNTKVPESVIEKIMQEFNKTIIQTI